ncbi:MAG TPA: Gfo/Idh/MocA family oxidoreductase [Spirochaetia bacterium]|nr:Gfo/Idh/MocA family oxidoreductase [Spirochaetia bacterium]
MTDGTAIGVLGVGRMGLVHCELIEATDGLRLVAASSRSEELRAIASSRFGVKTYERHEEILSDASVEWIVIATTSDQHHHWALEAIEAGKHLIIEKPIAMSFRETAEIYDAAERKGLRVIPHQSRRWDKDFALVRRVLEAGTLGSIYRIETRRTSYSSGWAGWGAQGMNNPWRLKKDYGGGMLNDWAPHLVDQLLLIASTPVESVYAWMGGKVWTDEVDDHFWAELLFEDGLSARVEASNNFRIPLPRWNIVGTEGTLQVAGGSSDQWSEGRLVRELADIPEEVRYDVSGGELAAGFYPELAAMIVRKEDSSITPNQVLLVMRIIDLIKDSARTNKTIEVTM